MIIYILVSTKFEGYMEYGYNQAGYLVHFENCSWGMTDDQLTAVLMNLRYALSHDNFKQWVADCGHKIIKVPEDLSFERFWLEYDNPRDRFRVEPLWRKMNDATRHYIFQNIKAYKRYMKLNQWYTQLKPATYLGSNWRDEWDKIESKQQQKKEDDVNR